MHDYEVVVDDTKLDVPARRTRPAARAIDAARGRTTLISFRPRMSGVQQVDDGQRPRAGTRRPSRTSTARASSAADDVASPACTRAKVANDLGGGTTAVTDRVAANTGEANAIAKSTLNRHRRRVLRGRRRRLRQPEDQGRHARSRSRASASKFGGTFTVTSSTHSYRGATGYQTALPDLRPLLAHAARADAPARGARLVRVARGRRGDQQQRPGRRWAACA